MVGLVTKHVVEFAEFRKMIQQLVCVIFSVSAVVEFEERPLLFEADVQVLQLDGYFHAFVADCCLDYVFVDVFAGDEAAVVFYVAGDD